MGLRKVGNVDVFLDAEGLVQSIQLAGRSLYLTSDPGLLRKQFRGENLDPVPSVTELYNHVSTDAIIKANPDCYYYDDRLGTLLLRSLGGGGIVEPGDIRIGSQIQRSAGKLNGLDQSLSIKKDIDVSNLSEAHNKTVSLRF